MVGLALSLVAQGSTDSNHLFLWKEGEERYETLVAVIGHHGSCQPMCSEKRTVVVPPNVFYKVKVEVAQVDMHSKDEQVEVKVGGQQVLCSPKVASDYNCSLVECSQLNFGRVVNSELRIEVEARKTRDTCKCSVDPKGDVDCYSQLLSGLDPTYGALVRVIFEPQVRAEWRTGSWSTCNQFDCAGPPTRVATRTVQCRIFDPDDVGDGGSRCTAPAPEASRACTEAPECVPPPRCHGCFSVAHLGDVGLNWSAIVMQAGSQVVVAGHGQPLQFELLSGLAHVSCSAAFFTLPQDLAAATACVSLEICGQRGHYLSRPGPGTEFHAFDDLILSERDSSSAQFRMQATFHLRRVATAGYVLADPYTGQTSPSFVLAPQLPSYVGSPVMGPANETCSLGSPSSLMPPTELCHASERHMTCPDLTDGVFGRCCAPDDCPAGATAPDCEEKPGLALLTQGRCEDVHCSPIEERDECLKAAAALGFSQDVTLQLRLSRRLPSFCSWEFTTADNGSPALWLNKFITSGEASAANPQLCRCGQARPLRRYQWHVGEWSLCSRSCGKQKRYRQVSCHELVGIATTDPDDLGEGFEVVPSIKCREAELEEPSASEHCSTPECWTAEQYTRCAGKDRFLEASELEGSGASLVTNGNGTGPAHCVTMNASSVAAESSAVPSTPSPLSDLAAAAELCRRICGQLGGCVGFTFFDHVFGDPNVVQCCFLRLATRWQPNFRRATCHLARGAQTRSGCFCQVGWEIADGGGSMFCGAQRRGCCTTPDNGARSWCPTTSPSCGTQLRNQQHSDFCDPTGVAAVSEYTCRTHPGIKGRQCASARGISECNQIATVLGLPDTTPQLTLAMDMPSGCVWQRATSQLWLNQLVDAVNGSDSQKVNMIASEDMSELCSCPRAEEFYWEVEEWRPCYRITSANCQGAKQRTRAVYCVRADAGTGERPQVVQDSLCSERRPDTVEACSDCDRQVIAAVAEFNMPAPVPSLEESQFAKWCQSNLAIAANLEDAGRISVGHLDCCERATLRVEIRLSDGPPGAQRAADAADELIQLSRSAADRAEVNWIDDFESFIQFFSFQILGSYSWDSDSWSHCSEVCGGGSQTREVWCSWTNYETELTAVADLHCDAASRPEDQRSCASRPCKSCDAFEAGPQYVVSGGDQEMSRHEDTVYVTCAAGYGTVDDIRLVESECQDGEWTPLAVSCGRSCPEFVAASWKYEVHGSGDQHGSTRQVTCKRSETSPNSVEAPVSASVICQDGAWTSPSLVCTGDCLTPELSSAYAVTQFNGTSGDNIVQRGSVWHISCAPGFAAPGDQASVKLECERGSWSGLENIPDCKADCPRYKLSEGYEIVGDEDAQNVVSFTQSKVDGIADRSLLNITGVNHGISIGIRCVDGYGRVPGAVERVECNDGQWSSLSLFCAKDCRPFNTSSFEFSRFRVIMDMSRSGDPSSEGSSTTPDSPHGSKIIIGCKLDAGSDKEKKRGEVTCDNGRWIFSELRCFRDCAAYVPGRQYSALIPGALASQRNRSVPHGTQLLATCAQGFSALPTIGPNGGSSGSSRRITPSDLIAESECVDGTWTNITLQCFEDCPSWPMRQHMVRDSGGGLRVGSLLRLACGEKPDISIRCGIRGIWELYTEGKVGPRLTAEAFSKMCPSSFANTREAVMNMTFWAKLSDDERAMFMILALGCFGSLCGLACTYFLSPYVPDEPDGEGEGEADAESAEGEVEDPSHPGLRRFNLLTGEVERSTSRSTRGRGKRSLANGLARIVRTNASRLAGYLQDASPQPTGCANCDKAATHVCFPCSHLCLCVTCADDLLRSTGRAFQELGPAREVREERIDSHRGSLSMDEQPCCPLCGQFVFCVIDAKPAKVFDVPGPLDMAVTAASAAAHSLRRTAVSAAQGAASVASRHVGVSPTMVGRSRESDFTVSTGS